MVISFAHVRCRLSVIAGVVRSSCSPLISVVCRPALPGPTGIIQEPLLSQPPQLPTENSDLLWLWNHSDHLKWFFLSTPATCHIRYIHRYQNPGNYLLPPAGKHSAETKGSPLPTPAYSASGPARTGPLPPRGGKRGAQAASRPWTHRGPGLTFPSAPKGSGSSSGGSGASSRWASAALGAAPAAPWGW